MQGATKRIFPAITLFLISASAMAVAAEENTNPNKAKVQRLERRISSLEQKNQQGIRNPWARPEIGGGFNLFGIGDFLYWTANENGLAFADSISGPKMTQHQIEEPSFKWNPGFRIGLGYNLVHDDWDAAITWTCFHDSAHKSIERSSSGSLIPTWIHPAIASSLGIFSVKEAKSHLKLHINLIDVELGREFYVSPFLDLRPFFGVRSAWVQQTYKIEYSDFPSSLNISEFETRLKNNYWGLGMLGGLDTLWLLGGGFSLYGDIGLSLAYGHFHVAHQEERANRAHEETVLFRSTDRFSGLRAITDLALGVRFDKMLYDDRYHIGFHAGWEQHVFFSQNQMMQYSDLAQPGIFFTNKGNLTLNGATIGGRFDF